MTLAALGPRASCWEPCCSTLRLRRFALKRLLGPADQVVRMRALQMFELELILGWLDQCCHEHVSFGAELLLTFLLALRTEDHTDGYPQSDGSVEILLPPGKSVRHFRRVAAAAQGGLLSVSHWLGLRT